MFVVFAALSGLAGGAFYPLFASLVGDYFGERDAVRNFGVVYSAKLFGAVIGVGVPALLVSSHGLMIAFLAAGLIGVCAAVTTGLLHRPGLPTINLPGAVFRRPKSRFKLDARKACRGRPTGCPLGQGRRSQSPPDRFGLAAPRRNAEYGQRA